MTYTEDGPSAVASPMLRALSYARRGWAVIPLTDKKPWTAHGSHDATTDAGKIQAWWRERPASNIGIATGPESGLWVLDADGATGRAALTDMKSILPTDTPWVATGGGGIHIYFAWDDCVGQKVKFRPGLDTRARGGYVVAPPSTHKSGLTYEWIRESPTVAPACEELLALVSKLDRKPSGPPRPLAPGGLTAYGRATLDAVYRELSSVGQGSRDDRRNIAAFSLGRIYAAGHASKDDVVACVLAACSLNGLADDIGEAAVLKRTERAVDAGYAFGPRGPEIQTGGAS